MSHRKELLREQIARLRCTECGQAPTAADIKKVLHHPKIRSLDPELGARIQWMCDPCGAIVEAIDNRATAVTIMSNDELQTVVKVLKNRARNHYSFGKRPTYSRNEEEARAKTAAAAHVREVESVFREAAQIGDSAADRGNHVILFFPPSTPVTLELSIDGMANMLFWHLSIAKPFDVEASGTWLKRISTETILRVPDDVAKRVVTAFLGDAAEEKSEGVLKNVRHFYASYKIADEPNPILASEPQAAYSMDDSIRRVAQTVASMEIPKELKHISEKNPRMGSQIFAQAGRMAQAAKSGLELPDVFVIQDDEHLRKAAAELLSSKLIVVDRPTYPSSMEETVAQFARRRASNNHRYVNFVFETIGIELLLTKEHRESVVWHMTLMRYPDLETIKEAMKVPFLILRVPDDMALRISKVMNMTEGPAEGAFANIRHFFGEVDPS